MNQYIKPNKYKASLAFLIAVALPAPVYAHVDTPTTNTQLSIKDKALEGQQQVIKEAGDAIEETQKALVAIEQNDSKKALGILQSVLGELEALLAKYPGLELLSADTTTEIIAFEGNVDDVKQAISAAQNFLNDGKAQEARQILDELVSEISVTTTSIPVKTYPTAIKDAIFNLSKGSSIEAGSILYKALNTLDQITQVIPLPVLQAELLLTQASELQHIQGKSKDANQTDVINLTEAAREQLTLAQTFGYGNKNDYKDLYDAINGIERSVSSEKASAMWTVVVKFFRTLR